MHGGTNPGAPKNNRNAWKHGDRSAEAEEQLKTITESTRILRLLDKVRQGVNCGLKKMEEIIFLSEINNPNRISPIRAFGIIQIPKD